MTHKREDNCDGATAFEKIKAGLEDAIACAQGKKKGRVHHFPKHSGSHSGDGYGN